MALIEYNITVDQNGNSKVTCSVLEVDKNDRIQFRSNDDRAAILYQNGSPFTDDKAQQSNVPQAGVPFKVGKGTTQAFQVIKSLDENQRLHFDCGVLPAKNGSKPKNAPKPAPWVKTIPGGFQPWGSGDGTPPGDTGN
jgi:hypothetical protein